MNWREIHQVLAELILPGNFIRDVTQIDAATLLFSLRRPGNNPQGTSPSRITLMCCLSADSSRLHRTKTPFPSHLVPTPRFVSFLRSHLGNSQIYSALQISTDRIVRIYCVSGLRRRIVWLRLWSGASNCVVTDERGIILDALFRRPRRGEVAGRRFDPDSNLSRKRISPARVGPLEQYQLTHLNGAGDYNSRLDDYHRTRDQIQRTIRSTQRARLRFESERQRLSLRIVRLRAALRRADDYDSLRAAGQNILANAHLIDESMTQISALEGKPPIALVKGWSPAENARRYFREYRRKRSSAERLRADLATTRLRWNSFRAGGLGAFLQDPKILSNPRPPHPSRKLNSGRGIQRQHSNEIRVAHSANWLLRVGRSASANDTILRHYSRGNDYWLHCRDHPGAHVFLSGPRGKSPPLTVLLDAATLAVFFSKARGTGKANVHYTQVKNLRRITGGQPGAVLPLREKNLFTQIDQTRLRRLLSTNAYDADTSPEKPSHL